MKKLLSFLLIFCSLHLQAQQVTGYWYGEANVVMAGIQNNYLTELIISQKGTRIKGFFGYYFKDVYESFVVKGSYDPKTKKVIIDNIPIIYFKTNSTMNGIDCITSFYGTLRVSKVKTELVGYFYRDKKYTYTCPDLRVNYTLYTEAKIEDSIFKDMSTVRSFWKEQPPIPETVKGTDAKQESEMATVAPENKPLEKNADAAEGTAIEKKSNPAGVSVSENKTSPLLVVPQPIAHPDIVKINEDFKRRKQIVTKEIEVGSDSLRLSFYDNAEVDGDSISVFFNGKLIVTHHELTERAFNVYVQLDSALDVNEVSMFAENLGKYPPNTALMVINDGDKRYETFLSSDYNGNATIRLKHRKNSVADK